MNRWVPAALLALAASGGIAQALPHRFDLPGGLKVSLREDPERVLFRARLRVDLRPGDVPTGQEGLAQLALRLIDRGRAGHLRPTAFDRALDESGIQLTRRLTARAITWDLVCRNRDQDRALALLADRVLRPVMDPSMLDPERLACWREAQPDLAMPEARLQAALDLEGPPPLTEAGLGRVTFKDVETFRDRVFRPDRAELLLEGDLGLEQAKALALLSFGTWSAPAPAAPPGPRPAVPASTGVLWIDAPGAPLEVDVAAALPPDLSPALRDLILLRLAGEARLAPFWRPPTPDFTLRFGFTAPEGLSESEAHAQLQAQVDAVLGEEPTSSDLDRLRTAWSGAQAVRSLHPSAELDEDGLALSGHAARPEAVAAVTAVQFQAALRQWLAPANLRWGLLGDPKRRPATP